jgi:REP element-mobilizing transposase RayT
MPYCFLLPKDETTAHAVRITRMRRNRRPRQLAFDFTQPARTRNGKRIGRPPRPEHLRHVAHSRRPTIDPQHPVLVTIKRRSGLRSLRTEECLALFDECFVAARGRFGMTITDSVVLSNHIHLIVELDPEAPEAPGKDLAPEEAAKRILAKAVGALKIRLSRALNRLWCRKGKVWGDRYHAVAKETPQAVWNARRYVVFNARRHGVEVGGIDFWSSAPWYGPWRDFLPRFDWPSPFSEPRTWLGRLGYLRCGPLPLPV